MSSREERAAEFIRQSGKAIHSSDCATSIAPAEEPGPCDCKSGSAETGGEKAAPQNAVLIPRTLWQQLFDFLNRRMERDRWQNDQHRLREGLEDCAEPNRLRGMDGCAFCMGSGRRVDDAKDICVPCECVRPARQHSGSFVRELEANFPRSSQNQAVASGVEGVHEGTTADKSGSREPEKLNNAQKVELCDKCGFPESEFVHRAGSSGDPYHKFVALAESSLSSPPPRKDDLSAPTIPEPLSTQLDTTTEKI